MPIKPKLKRSLKKALAMFTLANMLNQTFLPTVAMALTSGPTAPEATSFEPIDTTDMVNPLTGDFTYNMPLLEVPGPEGSYPLSLSYHAGIQPNEDASWVGLGWTLNTGAINRNVNGYPDDWKNVESVVRDYWSGGETKTVGVNVGIGLGAASISAGLSFSQDTYRGFGVGASLSVGAGFNIGNGPFSVGGSYTIGVSPYGDFYQGAGIDVSISKVSQDNLKTSASVGLSTNFKSVEGDAGISVTPVGEKNGKKVRQTSLGATISSSGTIGGTGLASVGFSSVNNANAGRIQSETDGWGFGIPLGPISFGISYSTTRYWSDETTLTKVNGVLYSRSSITDVGTMDNNADDNYYLLDAKNTDIVSSPEGETQLGGTFPNTDDYSVSAQGLSGTMKLYQYQGVLYTQNKLVTTDKSKEVYQNIKYASIGINDNKQFRFVNDFSNAYQQSTINFVGNNYSFITKTDNGVDGSSGYENTTGYDASSNRLEGSKHIEYFKNIDIVNGLTSSKGLVDVKAQGFQRKFDEQIGAFMITNASGVTYHYALPAYSYNEVSFSQKRSDNPSDHRFNRLSRKNPYAYTWYLTAITGPDYVDRGISGISDDDWGYWVRFDYGKWVDNFNWRNPSEGYNRDIDNQFENYSSGSKEIYYLNAVRTRTHTAIFEKELRADGKGFNLAWDGSTDAPNYQVTSKTLCSPGLDGCVQRYYYPSPTMRLKAIFLMRNDQLSDSIDQLATKSGYYDANFVFTAYSPSGQGQQQETQRVFYGNNVIDKYDIAATDIMAKCIRRIQFNHDYSLCSGTVNSSDPDGSKYVQASNTVKMPLLGKLTLNSIDFQGQGGASIQPLTEFSYDLDKDLPVNQIKFSLSNLNPINKRGTMVISGFNLPKEGDILKFTADNATYCFSILKMNGLTADVQFQDQIPSSAISGVKGWLTKNPPYNKDAYDRWGCYKSDYQANDNENLARMTTEASGRQTDVWSLRKIKSSLGNEINVEYESDTYNRSVLNSNRSVIVNQIAKVGPYTYQFYMDNLNSLNNYRIGDKISAVILKKQSSQVFNSTYDKFNAFAFDDVTVTNYNSSFIEVQLNSTDDAALNAVDISGAQVTFPTANASQNRAMLYYGGGVRVKTIAVDDLAGNVNQTAYDYGLPGYGNYQNSSSGVTSYEPVTFDPDKVAQYGDEATKSFRTLLYNQFNNLLAIAREAPAPGVMYEYVNVTEKQLLANGSTTAPEGRVQYQYETFKANMLGIKETAYTNSGTAYNATVMYNGQNKTAQIQNTIKRNIMLKDYTARVGILKRITNYDALGNKISETVHNYLYDDLGDKNFAQQSQDYEARLGSYNGVSYKYQGVIQERYGNSRIAAVAVPDGTLVKGNELFIMNSKESYPAIKTGTTQIDYKNGNVIQERILGYDYYSGLVARSLTFDTYGNRTMNEVIPAYRIPAYAKMGLKTVSSDQNKQMLSQQAASYTYAVDASNTPIGVVSANVNTWSNATEVLDPDGLATTYKQDNIWRALANYAWMPTGSASGNITPIASFVSYFAANGSNHPSWQKTSQTTKYNVYSTALEAYDMNNQFGATKMGYANSKVLVTATQAKYGEIAFSGAEDGTLSSGLFSTGITKGGGVVITDTLNSHTGNKSLKVASGQSGFAYTVTTGALAATSRGYLLSVWVKPESGGVPTGAALYYQSAGASAVTPVQNYSKFAAGWYLLEMIVPKNAVTGDLTVGCKNNGSSNIYFDDFRFQPTTSAATSYVYDPQTGDVTYILGQANTYVRYQYDKIGRLVRTYKEVIGKNTIPLIGSVNYNHGKMYRPIWSNNGTVRCHSDGNGNYNGLLDSQQVDINPKTNQGLRWKNTTAYSSTCPRSIFAKIETTTGGSVTGPNGYYYNDYVVKFYSDEERTLPTTLTANTTFNFSVTQTIKNYPGQTQTQTLVQNYTINATTGSGSVAIGRMILSRCNTTDTNPFVGGNYSATSPSSVTSPYCMSNIMSLKPGTGYAN